MSNLTIEDITLASLKATQARWIEETFKPNPLVAAFARDIPPPTLRARLRRKFVEPLRVWLVHSLGGEA